MQPNKRKRAKTKEEYRHIEPPSTDSMDWAIA